MFQIPAGSPVFKAMSTEDIGQMRTRFISFMMSSAGDDFFYKLWESRKNGVFAEKNPKQVQPIKLERYEGFTDSESPVLGAQRLKRSIESQPLATNQDVSIEYTLPFEQSDLSMNKLWSILIQLEELTRLPKPSQMTINSYVRFCVHYIQLDMTSTFDQNGKPADHQKLVYFMNNESGQKFIIRFIDMLPATYMKRFFLTAFIVFKTVSVDDNCKFAAEFMQRLVSYMKVSKPKWIIAFMREITHCGFKNLSSNRFKLGCAAVVMSAARQFHKKIALELSQCATEDEKIEMSTNQLMINNALHAFVEVIEKEKEVLLSQEYDPVFMGVIIRTALTVCTVKSKLLTVLCQSTQ